jgi:hypothetical protein
VVLAQPLSPAEGFVEAGAASVAFLRLLGAFLKPLSARAEALAARPLRRMRGDLAVAGQGELLIAASS